jgi:hypothetical protein
MDYKNIKFILEQLLIKKHNFILQKHEEELVDEIQDLLSIANNINLSQSQNICNCEIDYKNIDKEIENNECCKCGLPIVSLD